MTQPIPLTECQHGGLYRINSRNLSLGVFNKEDNGFIGIREKFFCLYLFTEYHWDTGAPFGTVQPQELLEMYPHEVSENVSKTAVEADFTHMSGSHLVNGEMVPLKPGDTISVENKVLYNWLVEKHKQYLNEDLSEGIEETPSV